jgi:hypothetical protein
MFNLFSKAPKLDNKGLKGLLDEVISPAATAIGLEKKGDYLWSSCEDGDIRQGLQYSLLKGDEGTLTWGVCINFVPLVSGSTIKLYKTEKSFKFHLFEWTDGYNASFTGRSTSNDVVKHRDARRTKESLKALIDINLPKASLWLDACKTTEQIVRRAELQLSSAGIYTVHHPSPNYILPFLYAKQGLEAKAVSHFNSLDISCFNRNQEMKDKVFKYLVAMF